MLFLNGMLLTSMQIKFGQRDSKEEELFLQQLVFQYKLTYLDTGTRFTHESLIRNYRGNKNGVINHNFNWYDPSGNSSTPVDQNGHGTHVMGTAAGGQGGRQIGMAPESSWISCRPFGSTGNPANFIKCLQLYVYFLNQVSWLLTTSLVAIQTLI